MARLPGALLFVAVLAPITLAQSQLTPQAATAKTPSLSMPMVAPVFLEDTEFTSTVTLVNDAIDGLSARVLVLDPHGIAAAQREFKLPGHTSLPIRIHDLLEESGSAVTTGSVIVITASRIRHADRRATFHYIPGRLDPILHRGRDADAG